MNTKKSPEIAVYNKLVDCIRSCENYLQLDNFYRLRIKPHIDKYPYDNGLLFEVSIKCSELQNPKESLADEQDTIYMKIINRNQK